MWGRAPRAVRRDAAPFPASPRTTLTKTKTRARPGVVETMHNAAYDRRSQLLQPAPTTRSKISRSFSPVEARNSLCRGRQSKGLRASADSVLGREFDIPNMARARCTSVKEKAKKPRLRYNFHASD